MLRIPHSPENRLTDGDEVVSLKHLTHSTPQKKTVSVSGTQLCSRLSKPQGIVRLEGLGKFKKFNDSIRNRTRDLPVRSTAPQPLHYRVHFNKPVMKYRTFSYNLQA
jgi:hypothetical protein